MKKSSKISIFIAIALLVLGMAFFPKIKSIFTSGNSEQNAVPMGGGGGRGQSNLMVNATILTPQTLDDIFRVRGILLPDEEVDLTFETSGRITDIYFREGASVRRGDLLAKVNDAPLQAELKRLEAQLPLAQDRVRRQQTLLERDAVSQETYQSVTTALATLQADIELVKARIRQTELRAPFDGVIGLRQVSEGAFASPSVVLAKLTKLSPLKIEFSLSEVQVDYVRAGSELTFTVDNSLERYSATVYATETRLDRATLTVFARALYDNPGGRIRPGQSAAIYLRLDRAENTIVIPTISSVREMGRRIAYVYDNGRAREVEIVTGLSTESSLQVIEGLSLGDTLLTTGVMQLRTGMPVTIGEFVPNGAD
jgi:membrane fusion protein (multidrug efflux system)